jgi:NAD dependent epimerase/dehydratase family.
MCRERADSGNGSYRLVEGDVRDVDAVTDIVVGVDYVSHEAAQAGVRPSVENPRTYDELNGEPPVVYGDGTQPRDFTYIDDVVRANVRLLSEDGADGGS